MTFSNACNIAYKAKLADGRWSKLMEFQRLGEMAGHAVAIFSALDPKEGTIEMYIGSADDSAYRRFVQCKFYGTWERSPHVCGKDCPL